MKRIKLIAFILIISLAFIGCYGFFIEPENIEVTHLWPDSTNLKDKLKGKTVVVLTDLHIKKIGAREKRVLKLLDGINPDFIFLTGDYVKWDGDYKPALAFLSQLKAKIGIWAVMGDYDYSKSGKSCLFCHDKGTGKLTDRYPVKFLRNNKAEIIFSGKELIIAGVDKEYEDEPPDIDGADIILSHSPLFFDSIKSDNAVLVLSGDTHGGQIPLPSWLWSILGYEKNAKYDRGWFKEGKKMMYVSRGIGTSHVRFRLFCRPEVVVLHF